MARTFDPEAARAELRGRITANNAELVKVRDRAVALALDVALGNEPQAELDAATAEQTRLQATANALAAALAEVDKREAAQQEEAAAAKRRADEAEHKRLMAVVQSASATAADLVDKLAAAVIEAVQAEAAALVLARQLDRTQHAAVGYDIALLMGARMEKHLPGIPWQRPSTGDEAESRLKAV